MVDVDKLIEFWRCIPLEVPYVHPLDAARLRELGIDLEDYGIFGSLFPQPWVGPIASARAYVLQLNPGFSGDEVEIEQTDTGFCAALRENLFGEQPNIFLDDRFTSHPGRKWVQNHLKGVASLQRLGMEIAQVELFPYHSKSFKLPAKVKRHLLSLPSVELIRRWAYSELVPAALRGEIGLVVQRSVKEWQFTSVSECTSLAIYRGGECRGGWITANTRGGRLIMRHLSN